LDGKVVDAVQTPLTDVPATRRLILGGYDSPSPTYVFTGTMKNFKLCSGVDDRQ
jgi:hypothetical protein